MRCQRRCWSTVSKANHMLRNVSAINTYKPFQKREISTKELTPQDLKSLKVDKTRLMDTLHHTCAFGTGIRWGR